MLISRARATPMRWGSRTVRPHPGMTPTRACVSAKRARSDAMRKSQFNATSNPPVTATPLIAPISGFVRRGNAPRNGSRPSAFRSPTSAKPSPCCTWPEPNSLRSTPAQNAGSVPVRIITSTASSASHAEMTSGRRRRISRLSALRASGRFSVTTATRSRTSQRTTSLDTVTAKVERHLDRAGLVLRGQRSERVTPVVERERVGQHAAEIDSAVRDELQVVIDPVPANAFDLLEAERVRPDHRDLLEVQRRVLPVGRSVHTGLDERSARLQHASPDLERLSLADGVVDNVDSTGVRHRQPVA